MVKAFLVLIISIIFFTIGITFKSLNPSNRWKVYGSAGSLGGCYETIIFSNYNSDLLCA